MLILDYLKKASTAPAEAGFHYKAEAWGVHQSELHWLAMSTMV